MKTNINNISLNKIYAGSLALLSAWMFFLAFWGENSNPSINQTTTLLAAFVVATFFLYFWLRPESNEPLLLVLFYHVITYYFLRIISLNYFEYSTALNRFGVPDFNQLFYAFVVIILSVFAIFLGYVAAGKKLRPVIQNTIPLVSTWRVYFILFVLSIIIALNFGHINSLVPKNHFLLKYLFYFNNPAVLFIPLVLYFFATKFEQKIPALVLMILVFINTFNFAVAKGVRGEIVYFVELIFYVLLVTNLTSISRKTFLSLLVGLPLLMVLLLNVYIGASFQRQHTSQHENIFSSIAKFQEILTNTDQHFYFVEHIAARIGSLDYSAELIINKHQYEDIFNLNYYKKSAVDNLVTPGFDIYDSPRVGQSTVFNYTNLNNGIKSRQFISKQPFAHSDELTIIGEFYALFGLVSLPLLLVVSFAITKLYYSINFANSYYNVVAKLLLLIFLSKAFHSFGVDWLLLDIILYIPPILTICWFFYTPIFNKSFSKKNIQSDSL